MRIVMFTNTYLPHVGGVARSVSTTADELRRRGADVGIVAPQFENATESTHDVLRVPAIQNFSGSDFSVRIPQPAVIGDFLEDAADLVRQISRAARERDVATFRDCAHALRSSAAHIGATAVFELCLGWRRITPEELAEHGASHAARLESAFEQLRAALDAVLAEQGRSPVVSRPR